MNVGKVKSEFISSGCNGVDRYLATLKALDGQESVGTDGKVREYKFHLDLEAKLAAKAAEVLEENPGHWKVEIIGLWLWVSQTEKPDAVLLGRAGCKMGWNTKRQAWQWKPYPGRARYAKTKSKDDLRLEYGAASL